MGYSINGTTIKLTRGDTFYAQIGMKTAAGQDYTPEQGDKIRFALKSKRMKPGNTDYIERAPLILKTIPNDTCVLHLEPNDTKSLPFGEYDYDIELTYANGNVDTFIHDATLELTKEVF